MLIELTVENYRSFRDPVTLSMIASREQRFRERLPKVKKRYGLTITPVAAVFGANASGKSNLVQVLSDLAELIAAPPRAGKLLPHRPFKLDGQSAALPTRLNVLFLLNEQIYEYILAYDSRKIVEEKLTLLLSRSEKLIFHRREKVELGEAVGDTSLETLVNGVADNIPVVSFLGGMKPDAVPHREPMTAPFEWVKQILVIPAGMIEPVPGDSIGLYPRVPIPLELIKAIDLGIEGISRELVSLSQINLGEWSEEDLRDELALTSGFELESPLGKFEISESAEGEIQVHQVRLIHRGVGENFNLEWNEESDGTKAVLRLLALFTALSQKDESRILVIDELDRSFHTELSRALIDGFLALSDAGTRSQLLFTTHDLLLMDPDRLRRDEMWLTEKDQVGASSLIGVAEYREIRKDADMRKSYLMGRFGGVPNLTPLRYDKAF